MHEENTLRDQVEAAIEVAELQRAQGRLSNGNWHYLRAYPDADAPTGWTIIQGEDASPCYSEREHFGREEAPVTFWTCQETDFGGPHASGCVWEGSGWDEGDYAHPADDYENYICLGAGFVAALGEAMDAGLIPEAELPDDEAAAKAALIAAGFEPFELGEWAELPDLHEIVDQAVDAITTGRAAHVSER